jgi:hypothetical protein
MAATSPKPALIQWTCKTCGTRHTVQTGQPHPLFVSCGTCAKHLRNGDINRDEIVLNWLTCNSQSCQNAMCQQRLSKQEPLR